MQKHLGAERFQRMKCYLFDLVLVACGKEYRALAGRSHPTGGGWPVDGREDVIYMPQGHQGTFCGDRIQTRDLQLVYVSG